MNFNAEWAGFRAHHMMQGMQRLPIEAAAAEEARIVIALEHDYRHDVRCQHSHKPDTVPCSINVTHRINGCNGGGVICAAAAGYEQRKLNGKYRCKHCLRNAEDCWTVTPWG